MGLNRYANPYRDDEDEFGEPAKAYGKRKRERVEREIDFFSSFVNQQSQQQWGTWFQKKNTAIPNEAGPNNSLVWPIFRLILSYKNSVYDQSMPNSAPPTTAGSDENTQEVNASGQRLLNPAQMDPQFLYSLLNLKDRLNEPVLTNTFAAAAVSEEEAAPAPAPTEQDALSSSQTFYDEVYPLLREYFNITKKFGFPHTSDTDLENYVKTLYTEGGEPKSNPSLNNLINVYRGFLDIQKQKRDILLEIGSKNLKPLDGDFVLNDNRLYPSLQPLLTNKIDVEKLTNIKEALDALDPQQLKGFMTRYDEALRDIAKDSEASNSGSYNSTWVVHFKNLTTSLAQYESGNIMPRLTAVLDSAREAHMELGLSAGYFINVADFERQYPEKYAQIFEAITAQNTSPENSPPVDQIKLWLKGWENSDDPEGKIRLYLKELTQPGNEKTSVAEGDTLLSGASTSETPSGEVKPAAKAPTSTPSRSRNIPRRIASIAFLGGIGAVLLAGIRSFLKQGFKPAPTAPAAAPAAPAPAPAPAPTPPTGGSEPADAVLKNLNEAITFRGNPSRYGDIPPSDGSHPLTELLRYQGQGGLSSKVGDISGGTREELIKLAEAAGITDTNKQNEMIALYTKAYDNAYIRAYDLKPNTVSFGDDVTGSVHANAMTKSLEAVRDYIKDEHARAASPVGWLQDRFGDATDNIASAFTKTAERVVGSIPINASVAAEGPPAMPSSTPNPLATMMQGAVSRLEGVAHNVAVVAQHPAAQAAMRGLGVVGVVASVAKTVHEARSGNTALAVMNGAAAVATAAATVGMPPVAAAAGLARIGAYAADRSQTGTLDRVLAQKTELTNKLATLKAESPTLGSRVQTVTTHVALATKKADVLASQQLNALRENVQSGVEATSQMLTQAQEVTGNAVASTRQNLDKLQQKFASLFTQRHAATL